MDLKGQKIVVVGLGRTALAVVKLLLHEGGKPFVTEARDAATVAEYTAELDSLGVPWECGGHTAKALQDAVMVVPSPGVPPRIAPIQQAAERGAQILSEMELAWHFCDARILAVTGTNGKTTTTELLRTLVAACGHEVILAGNNDMPFSAAVMAEPTPEYIVLEVSSYQLELASQFRPWIGAVLNLTPDHLGRHGTMEEYARVKARMFARQGEGDVAVINDDDGWTAVMPVPERAALWVFSLKERQADGLWLDEDLICHGEAQVAVVSDVCLPGRHNLENVLAALSMMRAGGFDWEKTLEGLRSFRGVEHRIEFVRDVEGVAFYNDSKSTNIDSLKVALESFEVPVVLIAGGEGKGADYGVLRELVGARVKRLITIGQDALLLEETFAPVTVVEGASDMADAVARAGRAAEASDVVLLSPACASFDMYDNFEHRGRVFKEIVQRYGEEQTA